MTIALPPEDDLDQMAQSIAGCGYKDLSADHRVLIMQLAIQNEASGTLIEIEENLRPIAEWFDKSKVYWP